MGKYCRSHIGKTFNDGKITVVDGGDKNGCVRVKCSVCAEDSELFGDGVFEAPVGKIVNECLPCGCRNRVLWTLPQYAVLINRKIKTENLPIKFVGFGSAEKQLSRTPVKLLCLKENTEYICSTITSFLRGRSNNGKVFTVDERIDIYNTNNPNHFVWNSGKRIGQSVVCGFRCSICESKGLESIFEIRSDSLLHRRIPCYCSKKKNISGCHIVEMAKEKLHVQELAGVSVIGAYEKHSVWLTVFLCEIHGVYSRRFTSLNRVGCRCLKCSPSEYGYNLSKNAFLYLLDICTPSGLVLGYGITNKLNNRLTTHRKNIKSIGATITNIQVFEGSGTAVLAVENAIKSLHTTGLLDCEGFRRESISIDMKDKVLEKCKKLKELDNADKLI